MEEPGAIARIVDLLSRGNGAHAFRERGAAILCAPLVGQYAPSLDAVDRLRRADADVVLMDLRMPRMDGIEATRRIVGDHPAARVLVLTTFEDERDVFSALRAGASGYLLKDAGPEELLAAIRAVHAGDAVLAPSVTRRVLDAVDFVLPTTGKPGQDECAVSLTDRERDVLAAMADGLSNREIADRLSVSETTVKTHVGRLLLKLDARDRLQAVVYAVQRGLVTIERR
jgi:DNA-binding NarL/FixJ family response regulator